MSILFSVAKSAWNLLRCLLGTALAKDYFMK